jgi:hypothetical protein
MQVGRGFAAPGSAAGLPLSRPGRRDLFAFAKGINAVWVSVTRGTVDKNGNSCRER